MSQIASSLELSSQKRALLQRLLRQEGLLDTSSAERIVRQPEREHYPLSFAQQRLWFLHQLHPLSPAYNVRNAILLRGLLNIPALELSLSEIIRRHEPLRTRFSLFDSQPVQIIDPPSPVSLHLEDLSHLPDPHSAAIQLARDEASTAFDLERGPVIRLRLLRLSDNEHVLLLSVHHIAFDGWSTGVLVRELRHLYTAFREGRQHSLPEPPVSYADYAVWQRQWLSGSRLDEQLDYWREQLKGAPAVLELPSDRSRPAVRSERGARQRVEIEAELVERLREVGRREGATLYMVLLAGWKALLMRYSGEREVVVGTPVAGRGRGEVEGLIGLFINMVAVRTRVDGGERFEELVRKVKESALGAYGHQELPFERLVEELQPERSLSHTPLFQVVFALHNSENDYMELADLELSTMDIDNGAAKFDLSLFLTERKHGVTGSLVYSTDLYEEETISRMLSHYLNLLSAAAANPSLSISRLPLLTTEQRRDLLSSSSNVEAPPAHLSRTSVTRLFEQQVEQTPEAVALVCGNRSLTYRELNRRANRLAHRLRRSRIGAEQRVGILAERSVELLVAVLAVLKAGGAYVPLDPAYPRERLEYMMRDAGLKVLLTQEELAASWAAVAGEEGIEVIVLREEDESLADLASKHTQATSENEAASEEDVRNLVCEVDGENLAYVIYTSGSTGKPKGVQVRHRALTNFLLSMRERPGMDARDTILAVTTLSFDIAALELFLPLVVGARIRLLSREAAADGAQLIDELQRSQVTVMQATPATWRLLLEAGWKDGRGLKALCGGEALPRDLAAGLIERGVTLWNMYGPTESTIWSAICEVKEDKTVTVGRPIHNTEIYVLDERMELVPEGVVGEVYIGGEGLARGYLGRAGLTAERFVPDALSGRVGGRLYRSGDKGRRVGGGELEVVGRADGQVKVRGYRVEVGEVESALMEHEDVSQAVVMVREDTPGDKRLVAYLILQGAGARTTTEWRQHLKRTLPDYMVPSSFIVLDELPLTPNGKIDRKALPAPDGERPDLEQKFSEPRTALQLQLVHLWEEILSVRPIGITDNFFDLGGHSLLAKRLLLRVETQVKQTVPLTLFFQEPTIKALAATLEANGVSRAQEPLVAIQPHGTRRPFFCVHSVGGDVIRFYHLARCLGDDQPFYGFQAPHPSELTSAKETIEELAERYISAMRLKQPQGPYLLGGYSFGSIVAYEMAQQLKSSGERIGLLALFDGVSPLVQQRARERSDGAVLAGFARDLARSAGVDLSLPHEQIEQLGDGAVSYIVEQLNNFGLVPNGIGEDYFRRFVLGLRVRTNAVRAYRARKYEGELTLFRCMEVEKESSLAWQKAGIDMSDKTRGWDELADGGLSIEFVPGHHATMMSEPHVRVLAEKLRNCMERAESAI